MPKCHETYLSFVQQNVEEQIQTELLSVSSSHPCCPGRSTCSACCHCGSVVQQGHAVPGSSSVSVVFQQIVCAERTKNFSGAEIEGLVKSAASFALNRQVDVNDLSKKVDEDNIKVLQQPFIPIS